MDWGRGIMIIRKVFRRPMTVVYLKDAGWYTGIGWWQRSSR